jgi:hypothetical protein
MGRTVELDGTGVRIGYSGVDRALTLTRDLTVPYELIQEVDVGLADAPSPWTLRRVGLGDPIGGRRRGRFWKDGRRYFLDLREPEGALTLRLRPGAPFDVVALETDDAEHLAEAIRSRIGSAAR